ncbi:hypothetical protein EJB05_05183, partial [Eragrostis curvula]
MAGEWEGRRILVGGLAWQTDDRKLEDAFRRFGRIVDAQVIVHRESGASRGFGFVTFESQLAADSAIREMHYQELDGRIIEVYNAETWKNTRNRSDTKHGNGGRGGHYHSGRGGARRPGNCFTCGLPGHWARDCHSTGGHHSVGFSVKFSGGARASRFSGSHSFDYRYMNNGYGGSRFRQGDQVDYRGRYVGRRGHYANDQFPSGGERLGKNMYGGGSGGFAQSGYHRARGRSCDAQSGGYSRVRGRSCDAQSGGYSRPRGRSRDAQSGGCSRPRGRSRDTQSGCRRAQGRSCEREEVFVSFKAVGNGPKAANVLSWKTGVQERPTAPNRSNQTLLLFSVSPPRCRCHLLLHEPIDLVPDRQAAMAGKEEESRILVSGLSWLTNDRKLEEAFGRFGKVVDAQIVSDISALSFTVTCSKARFSSRSGTSSTPPFCHHSTGRTADLLVVLSSQAPVTSSSFSSASFLHSNLHLFSIFSASSSPSSPAPESCSISSPENIEHFLIMMERHASHHRGFGYVTFEDLQLRMLSERCTAKS